MPAFQIAQDIDLAEIPICSLPLMNDTDLITREESVVYNAAGMDLAFNSITVTGVFTQTSVTPTTSGDYDWTNQGNGIYTIGIPASGGISINNDSLRFAWFTGVATGILPWYGPVLGLGLSSSRGWSDIWLNQDVDLQDVPISIVPLQDDTDFKTIEAALVYNQAGLDLSWNFLTAAGAFTQTAVTPTTGGGDYDWSNQGRGIYTVGMPASGGASVNNDSVGYGWFEGFATGVLSWRGPRIGFDGEDPSSVDGLGFGGFTRSWETQKKQALRR